MSSKNTLDNGWTWNAYEGAVCRFRHFPMEEAQRLAEAREKCFVVETINWTLAKGDATACHMNEYFAFDMAAALAMAARMEIDFQQMAEDVVGIRPATESETERYFAVQKHFCNLMPEAISEPEAEALGIEDDAEE